LARLEGALKFASFCKEFIESAQESKILKELAQEVTPMLDEMDAAMIRNCWTRESGQV
jgi:hypothetical protein